MWQGGPASRARPAGVGTYVCRACCLDDQRLARGVWPTGRGRRRGVKLVIFGLTVSSSWGNGHATLWRGLVRALARDGHTVVFFERDVDYYARHRDLQSTDDAALILYETWNAVLPLARRHLAHADVALVTSYCPDARA